jgi:hypothetical protein
MLSQQLATKLATSLLRTHLVDKLLEQHYHNLLEIFTTGMHKCKQAKIETIDDDEE